MIDDITIAFVGSGNMAEAIMKGLLQKSADVRLRAADPIPERRQYIAEHYNVEVYADNGEAIKEAHVIILAVKPQVILDVFTQVGGLIPPHALVMSIVAGVRVATLVNGLRHKSLVRVMPNTPAMVGQGMSVWIATPEVTEAQQALAKAILQAIGEEVRVTNEEYLDMATAISGSGPAYVFLFIEALIDAGVHMGLSRYIAEQLVLQTLQGAVAFARQSKRHPAELKNMVTSPGGTTAAALYQLEKAGLRAALSRAVWAAYQQARHLGGDQK